MFQKYINKLDMKEIIPDGSEIFVGITLVKIDGVWKQKSAFSKIQGMGNTYKTKKKKDYSETKEMVKDLDSVKIKEMSLEDW